MLVIHLLQQGMQGWDWGEGEDEGNGRGKGRGLKKSEEGPWVFYYITSEVSLRTEHSNPFKQLYSLVTNPSNLCAYGSHSHSNHCVSQAHVSQRQMRTHHPSHQILAWASLGANIKRHRGTMSSVRVNVTKHTGKVSTSVLDMGKASLELLLNPS